MPLTLQGSCRCGAVAFTLASHTPYPYQRCYCSICRKAGAGGGYAVNIMGDFNTLDVKGRDSIGAVVAEVIEEDGRIFTGSCQRHFCKTCATMLWVYDDNWPDLVHPFASCIDTDLPAPPALTHLMLDFKPAWVTPQTGPDDRQFARYPDQSIEDWHRSRGLWID